MNYLHEGKLQSHSERMDEMDKHARSQIASVMDWVANLRQDETNDMNFLKEAVERINIDMNRKISYVEVDDKISLKVKELVSQIKEALLAVEEDEAEFKNVANGLHELFNSLKKAKADKSEMAHLRNEMISGQLSCADNKGG